MIESRYKIEYELPENDVKKTLPLRRFFYLSLIPLILAIVGVITYDFSLKDMSRDSSVLLQKVKLHLFNLGDEAELRELKEQNRISAKLKEAKPTIITSENNSQQHNIENLENNKAIETTTEKHKMTIVELSKSQELQLKTIQEQIAKNTELTRSLNNLSEQLVHEKTRNESLSSRIAEQELDRLELEEELYKISEQAEKEKTSIDELAISKEQNIVMSKPDTDKPKKSAASSIKLKEPKLVVDNNEEESIKKSDTDKIIEAMATVEPEVKPHKESPLKENLAKIEKNKEVPKEIPTATAVKSQDEVQIKTEVTKTVADKKPEKVAIKEKEAVKEKQKVTESPKVEEPTKNNSTTQQDSSSVDAIIAAMQGVKADVSDKPLDPVKQSEEN